MWLLYILFAVLGAPFVAIAGLILWQKVTEQLLWWKFKFLLLTIVVKLWWRGEKKGAREIWDIWKGKDNEDENGENKVHKANSDTEGES